MHRRLLFAIFAITLLTPAMPAAAEDVLSSSAALSGVSGALWPDGVVPVCFETDEFPSLQAEVERELASTWARFSDVVFTGFGSCEAESGGVRVAFEDRRPRVAAPGRHLDGIEAGVILNPTFENWDGGFSSIGYDCAGSVADFDECFRRQVGTIFGYVLGFSAEDSRPDSPSKCELFDDPAFVADRLFTTYDPSSIMTFCDGDPSNGFSSRDVQGARVAYGPWDGETPIVIDFRAEVRVVDDESIGSNEIAEESFSETIVLAVDDDFTGDPSRYAGISESVCAGNETRVDVVWGFYQSAPGNRPAVIVDAELFEGKSCDTDDLEDDIQRRTTLEIGDPTRIDVELHNAGFGGGDSATLVTRVSYNHLEMMKSACGLCEKLADQANEPRPEDGHDPEGSDDKTTIDPKIDPDLTVDGDYDVESKLAEKLAGWS